MKCLEFILLPAQNQNLQPSLATGIKKNFMLNNFLFLIFFLVSITGAAQQSLLQIDEKKAGQLKALGKEAERQGQIYLALEYYKQLVAVDPENLKNQYHLAELYRYTRNYKEAEVCFEKISKKHSDQFPASVYYLAVMQKANGKHKEAKENLLKFKKLVKNVDDEKIKRLYKTETEGCDLAIALKDSVKKAIVNTLGAEINNPHIDFSPIPVAENKMIFGSLREKEAKFYKVPDEDTLKLPTRKFYQAEKQNEEWKFKGELEGPFNTKDADVANGTYSLDRTKFYFTKCAVNWQYKMICKIYYSEKKGNSWTEPVEMDEQINMPNYTSTHPTIGRESKKNQEVLYFVSDRPGSKGGTDIWYSEYDVRKKIFKAPRNAGAKVNTVGTETTPFYDVKTRTLYYSTDGKANIGGLDVFKTTGELNKWDPSVNLGLPINSTADDLDFALRTDSKGGFVVSNREGGQSLYNATCCDDIYEFVYTSFIELVYMGKVIDKNDKKCVDDATLSVYIINEEKEKYLAEEVKVKGCDYRLDLRPGFNYLIEASKDNYFNNNAEVSTTKITKSDTLRHTIEIENIPAQPIVIPKLNYDFNSAILTADSKTILDTSLLVILRKNPDIIIELSSHTDNKGTDAYNMKLSQKRAESVVAYLTGKGIASERLVAKGYGETKPIAPNENKDGTDSPEGRQLNRRTEFKVIGKIDASSIRYETVEDDKVRLKQKKEEVPEE